MNKKGLVWLLIPLLLAVTALACNFSSITTNPPEENQPTAAVENSADEQSQNQETNIPATAEASTEETDSAQADSTTSNDEETTSSWASPCANDFFPVSEGAVYTYTTNALEKTDIMVITFKDVNENTFTEVQTFPDFSTEVTWQCTEEGLVSLGNAQLNLPDAPVFTESEVNFHGATLPNADGWEVGLTWETSYVVTSTATMQDIKTTIVATANYQNEITAIEEINVPAGTYKQAYRVDSTGFIIYNTDAAGLSVGEIKSEFQQTAWYVSGIGLVKNVAKHMDDTTTVELASFK